MPRKRKQPVVVVAHYRVSPADVHSTSELLARHSVASEAEPGCVHFRAHQDAEDPTCFVLYEEYVDAAAFEQHRRTSHFVANIQQTLVPQLLGREWRVYGAAL